MTKSIFKSGWFYLAVILAVVIIYLIIPKTAGLREYDTFATCLTERGVIMYGTEWCHNCKDQKEMFGKSFDKINYVDCDRNREECLINRVEGYPTWKIKGQNYAGTQPLVRIASLSGCELVKDI
ncbi:MAG: hypothetical protein NUV97_02070 [archaeon]|nr:hypothetical protein [archaeon]MCR4323737.1 hypothetical protein [Nanoarchaeota archaeon]